MLRIVIVEDSALIRAELVRLVSAQPGLRVVGVAGGEDEAVTTVLALRPDAVLLDLGLAPGSGLQVLRRLRAAGNTTRVAVLTSRTGDVLRDACLTAGANAFFDKNEDVAACLDLLRSWRPSGPPVAEPHNA